MRAALATLKLYPQGGVLPTERVIDVGALKADLWVSTDAEDTDFIVKLVDIYPNGYEALVQDQGFRLRHHKGLYSQTRVEPNRVYPIQIDLWSTALIFTWLPGSSISRSCRGISLNNFR